ncbi:SLOG family protein [Streptomyces sp. AM6-12]|uniref:SLOG family protein n=1 Tax=Streptomyces sp. AM6-12 TaxID=3345149 RepID=UPI0037AAA06C
MKPYRILVTGSRDWPHLSVVIRALDEARATVPHGQPVIVVHGDCPNGADRFAKTWARRNSAHGITEEAHPAQWRVNGTLDRSAGFRRNADMVDLGANLCLAFIRNGSRGASHTAALAERAGIPVRRYTAQPDAR